MCRLLLRVVRCALVFLLFVFLAELGSNMHDPASDAYNMDGLVWSSEHLDILNSRITHEEIRRSMFSIDDTKAPGPDGFLFPLLQKGLEHC